MAVQRWSSPGPGFASRISLSSARLSSESTSASERIEVNQIFGSSRAGLCMAGGFTENSGLDGTQTANWTLVEVSIVFIQTLQSSLYEPYNQLDLYVPTIL
ncbi:MAG: hypothetical protein ACREP2_13630 [Rhodanobacteraceae bacterium]